MLTTRLTAAALAAALALVPAERAAADGKDFVAGAIIGGVVGSQLQKQKQRNNTATTASRNQQTTTTYYAPAPTIASTEDGRRVQASLNYFGFNAGVEDGKVGPGTRNAIAQYQGYLGYPITGELTLFEKELLVTSYFRAQAGGNATYSQIAAQPDGTRGLLKVYREEIANGSVQMQTLTGSGG